jgi:biotin carboxylase
MRSVEAGRLLVLGAGVGQLGLLAAARERGLFVIAVDRDPGAPGFRYADRRAILSVDDEPALERLAEAERVDGVIAPGNDCAVGAAARIAFRYGLRHPISPESAVLSTSKVRQRERLLAAGVPQARWKLLTAPGDPGLGLPCVVKSADRHGRRARAVVRSSEELEPAVQAALRASRTGRCLLEELVEGPELTVNAFSLGGVFHPLTVTDRLRLGDAFAHVWPSQWGQRGDRHRDRQGTDPGQALAGASAIAELAVTALGFNHGPTFTRLRIGPEGPRVIRASARAGGSSYGQLCEVALGVDLNGLALSAALGEEVRHERLEPRRGVGVCVLERATRTAEYVRFGTGDAEALA